MHDKIYSIEIYGEFGVEIYKQEYYELPFIIDTNTILSNINGLQYYEDNQNPFITIFKIQADEIHIILKCGDVNEIFISKCLEVFCEVLRRIIKKDLTKETLLENFDLLAILIDNFIMCGMIRENNEELLYKQIPKRGFEISGMKMTKGFSSFFNSFSTKK